MESPSLGENFTEVHELHSTGKDAIVSTICVCITVIMNVCMYVSYMHTLRSSSMPLNSCTVQRFSLHDLWKEPGILMEIFVCNKTERYTCRLHDFPLWEISMWMWVQLLQLFSICLRSVLRTVGLEESPHQRRGLHRSLFGCLVTVMLK